MLNLLEKFYQEKKSLRVIYDQISCPTSTNSLSDLCWELSKSQKQSNDKIFHWSDAGVASWYDFAIAIAQLAFQEKIITGIPDIIPIKSDEFPTIATRPHFSLLDCEQTCKYQKTKRNHWKFELSKVIREISSNKK